MKHTLSPIGSKTRLHFSWNNPHPPHPPVESSWSSSLSYIGARTGGHRRRCPWAGATGQLAPGRKWIYNRCTAELELRESTELIRRRDKGNCGHGENATIEHRKYLTRCVYISIDASPVKKDRISEEVRPHDPKGERGIDRICHRPKGSQVQENG